MDLDLLAGVGLADRWDWEAAHVDVQRVRSSAEVGSVIHDETAGAVPNAAVQVDDVNAPDGPPSRTPSLIVVNGPPGSGKSTLARAIVQERPLALNLDLDVLRSLLGAWEAHPTAAGLRAREFALLLARAQLQQHEDVIVPQYLARPTFLLQLEQVAHDAGAVFQEVVLLDEREQARRRFKDRDHPSHTGATQVSDQEWSQMYDRLLALLATRPNARVLETTSGDIAATHAALIQLLQDTPKPLGPIGGAGVDLAGDSTPTSGDPARPSR